jgi:tetratricopeptide (TPR) repeat protein
MLSGVYRALGQFEQAGQDLQQILKQAIEEHLEHLVPHALFELAQLYEAMGQAERALELFYWILQSAAAVAEHKREAEKGVERLGDGLTVELITAVQQQALILDSRRVLADLAAFVWK